jgi:galactokinase
MSTPELTSALERAGMSPEEAAIKARGFVRLRDAFSACTTHRNSPDAWFVPGRIEVLGKHTDYAGGRSLVCAAERGFSFVAAPRSDDRLAITDVARASTLTLDAEVRPPDVHWATYPLTVLRRLSRNFPEARRGADVVFESDLPSAAGMSSSSALMIGIMLVLMRANDLRRSDSWTTAIRSQEDLAAYAATIENGQSFGSLTGDGGVGTAGGSEDHTAILCSEPGTLGQYAFCPTRLETVVPLPPSLVFGIAVSGVTARKTGEARERYNLASADVSRILERWRQSTGRADGSLAAVVDSAPDAGERLRALVAGSDLAGRLEQFIEESTTIVPTAARQLGDGDLEGFSAQVARSQELAERLLRNQVPETIALVRSAREQGAIAASAFGAGFGGSVWALVERTGAPAFLERWRSAYAAVCAESASRSMFFLTRPGPAAFAVT